MHVHRSNRMERLVDALGHVVRVPVGGPLEPEHIVVQGRGMERWLGKELAERFGVWANPSFPFPRALLERAFKAVLGDDPDTKPWKAEDAVWSIAALLPELALRPELAPVARYLGEADDELRAFALAERVARVFDQYVVYRPRMILRWERGDVEGVPPDHLWQPVLWRALRARDGFVHVANRSEQLLRRIDEATGPIDGFPRRVSLFGVSTLPPLYLRLFAALSRRIDVHLFVLSPSSEYWAEVRSKRAQLRELAELRGITDLVDADDLHFEEGHPLLASLGKIGRDFQRVLEGADDYAETDADLYEPARGDTLLARLQRGMLELRAPEPAPWAADDESIRIHSCHGPMREIEVLHDRLLDLFERDPTLEPHDVVVMTPDVDAYAPVIQAVFERRPGEPGAIPFHVADRGVRATHPVVDAFEDMLDVLAGRFPASAVLDLLSATAVREKLEIEADEIETVRRWVVEAGIRWGVDAEHRAELGQPASAQNTWRFGLDRLLVGWALDASGDRTFGGVLPHDDVEGSAGELVGRLVAFCEMLFDFRLRVREPHTAAEWRDILGELLDRGAKSDPRTAHEHQLVRRALAALADRAERAGFDRAIPFRAYRELLTGALGSDLPVRSFLAGGVTFCQLVPMRSIPFRVVCLVGMSDGAFPRGERPLDFDLAARMPRIGDRTPRDDDRYLFLEALVSARDRLVVTYVGQSIHDNSRRPPSVVVSELVDAVTAMVPDDQAEALRAQLFVAHPLQPFSPRYFTGGEPRLFSYAAQNLAGARALLGERTERRPFIEAPLDPPAPAPEATPQVTLEDLERFFKRPLATFLERRLSLYVGRDVRPVPDREPIVLDDLERWTVGDRLVARSLAGADPTRSLVAIRASGILPVGTPGDVEYDDIAPVAREVAQRVYDLFPTAPLAPRDVHAEDVGGVTVTGVLRSLHPHGQIEAHYSKLQRRSELALFIRHLALGIAAPDLPMRTVLVGRGEDGAAGTVVFDPVDDPRARLAELVALYRLGQQVPLLLFDNASRAYAFALDKTGDPAKSRRIARAEYYKKLGGDCDDPYVRQVFGDVDPLVIGFDPFDGAVPGYPSFEDLASRVWLPLIAHRRAEVDSAEIRTPKEDGAR